MCQTPYKKTQTDRRQESKLVHLALECDIWWQYFNDFLITDQSSCIYWSIPDFYSPLKFLWSIALCPSIYVRYYTGWSKKVNHYRELSLSRSSIRNRQRG